MISNNVVLRAKDGLACKHGIKKNKLAFVGIKRAKALGTNLLMFRVMDRRTNYSRILITEAHN